MTTEGVDEADDVVEEDLVEVVDEDTVPDVADTLEVEVDEAEEVVELYPEVVEFVVEFSVTGRRVYKFNLFPAPQNSDPFPLQAILQSVRGAAAVPTVRELPQ